MNSSLIAAARRTRDTKAPSVPTGLVESSVCKTTLTLTWNASTDNVAVIGYKIYKNAALYSDVGLVTTEGITGQTGGSTNTWTVSAYDEAGNESAPSTGVVVEQGISVTSVSMTTIGALSRAVACATGLGTLYFDGTGTITNGDTIYTTICGVTPLNGGGDYYSDGSDSFIVSSVGVVSSSAICT